MDPNELVKEFASGSEIKKEDSKPKATKKKKQKSSQEMIFEAIEALEEEFDIDEMSLFLPAMKEEVIIRPIKSEEEFLLENPNLSMLAFIKKLNKLLFNHAEPLTDGFPKTLEEFEEKITPIDRTFMLFALIKNSFEKMTEFPMKCENCNNQFIADVFVENAIMKFNINEDEVEKLDYYNIRITKTTLNHSMEIDLGFNTEKVRLFLLQKTSDDEADENIKEENNLFNILDNFILYTKEIRVYKKDKRSKSGKKLVSKFSPDENIEALYEFLHNIPFKIKEILINDLDLDELEKFAPQYSLNIACPECGHVHTLPFQPEIEFFRKALYYS